MAREREAQASGFLGNRLIRLWRRAVVNLDGVNTSFFQKLNGLPRFVRVSDREPVGPLGRPIIEDRTRGYDSGAEDLP